MSMPTGESTALWAILASVCLFQTQMPILLWMHWSETPGQTGHNGSGPGMTARITEEAGMP